MAQKEYSMDFVLGAKESPEYGKTFKSAQSQLAAMQKEVAALNKAQSDISAYTKQQAAIDATKKALEAYQKQQENIQREIEEMEGYSSALTNAEVTKQLQIDRTSTSLKNQQERLEALQKSLEDAGVDTKDFAKEQERLANELDKVKAAQGEVADKANAKAEGTAGALESVIAAAGVQKILDKMADFAKEADKASKDYESAMTGVAKTTDMTEAELAAMGREFQRISSQEIPATAIELAAVAEAAGQLGIANGDIVDFTMVMTNLGIATNLTSEEAATSLAKFANITKMAAEDYSRAGSTVVALGNNVATTERDIVSMSMNIAAAGDLVGLTQAEIMGLSATLSALGIEAQAGGTSASKLMREFETMVATNSEALTGFASVAGMSADEFKRAWGDDALGTLSSFIDGLGAVEAQGGSMIATLDELGIKESRQVDAISRLANSNGLLTRSVEMANTAWAEDIALQAEAEKRYATRESQAKMAANAYMNLKVAIGDAYAPVLSDAYSLQRKVFDALAKFAADNPAAVRGMTAFVGVLGAATLGLTAYTAVTKIAAAASLAMGGAINLALGPIGLAVGALAVITTLAVGAARAEDHLASEFETLTAASREQYKELENLNAEYEKLVDAGNATSIEAQLLKRDIDALTASYEANKQTVEELHSSHEALMSSYYEQHNSHKSAVNGLEEEAQKAVALINALDGLSSSSESVAENQGKVQAIIAALNEQFPEYELKYDDLIAGGDRYVENLRKQATEKAKIDIFVARQAQYASDIAAQAQLEADRDKYAALVESQKAAEEAARAAYMSGTHTAFSDEYAAWKAAQKATKAAEEDFAEVTAALEINAESLAALESEIGIYVETQAAAVALTGEMDAAMATATTSLQALAESYNEAYDAAYKSVTGQYTLWDDAAKVVAVSAGTISDKMQAQREYWDSYDENLEKLIGKTGDIEGLQELLSSFADGSEASVNAIAGIAAAKTDEELRKLVADYKALSESQGSVSDSLALLNSDYANALTLLQSDIETAVADMDLNDKAVESGRNTIQGFIDAAEDMTPAVQAAYLRIANAATKAMDASLGLPFDAMRGAGSDVNIPTNALMFPGFAEGGSNTPYAFMAGERGPELVVGYPGSTVFPHADTQRIVEAVGGGGRSMSISLSPVYNITGGDEAGIRGVLDAQNENLREMILDILADENDDAERRAYA